MAITVQELIDNLNKIDNKDLKVYGIVGSSGVSYEVSGGFETVAQENEDGDLLYLEIGEPFVEIYLGN